MTDIELQIELAKLLPEHIIFKNDEVLGFYMSWKGSMPCTSIHSKEWLHVCWLLEHKLTEGQCVKYTSLFPLFGDHSPACCYVWFASWQQRAEALIKLLAPK